MYQLLDYYVTILDYTNK